MPGLAAYCQIDESDLADVRSAWQDGEMAKVSSARRDVLTPKLNVKQLKDYAKFHRTHFNAGLGTR